MNFPSLNEQMDLIRSGAVDVLPEEELVKKIEQAIAAKTPLNVKLGADPSRPDLHIGHAVVLHKLRQFQDLGHNAILIVGDFTAMIGDPSGRSKTRPPLTIEETRINGQTYFDQAGRILKADSVQIRNNSEWLEKLGFQDVVRLAANATVAQLLERDDFTKRFRGGQPISLHEFLYPLAQAYDSVAIRADVELGGTDQTFNLLLGREIQKAHGLEPQAIVTTPLLEGTDGVEKMSKSLDNYIALTDTPTEIFGRTMSIPDTMIARYFRYGAFAADEEVNAMENGLADGSVHPRNAKVRVAQAIVERYHNAQAAADALAEFERMFVKKDVPDDMPEFALDFEGEAISVVEAISMAGLVNSRSEARRMIQQNAVSVDGEKVAEIEEMLDLGTERVLRVGKRRFARIKRA